MKKVENGNNWHFCASAQDFTTLTQVRNKGNDKADYHTLQEENVAPESGGKNDAWIVENGAGSEVFPFPIKDGPIKSNGKTRGWATFFWLRTHRDRLLIYRAWNTGGKVALNLFFCSSKRLREKNNVVKCETVRVAFFVFREDHRARSLQVGIVTFCHSRATLFARLNYTRMLKRGHQNHGGMIGPLEDPRADILPGKKWQHLCRRGTSLNKVALLFFKVCIFSYLLYLNYCTWTKASFVTSKLCMVQMQISDLSMAPTWHWLKILNKNQNQIYWTEITPKIIKCSSN